MKILITGANGFIARNLKYELINRGEYELYLYDIDSKREELDKYTADCDFVFHLAGINRPKSEDEFMKGNYGFTGELIESLKANSNTCPIAVTSSIQAALSNPYGVSKKAGEELLFEYGKASGAKVYVYRLPNVFGKWCRPNYNSAVATFCNNIANNLPIKVNDPNTDMRLVYIDDVVGELIGAISGKAHISEEGYGYVPCVHEVKLGRIPELLYTFKEQHKNFELPDFGDEFEKKLYSTYLSYLPKEEMAYPLVMHKDDRGSFTEFLRTPDRGQVSVNISRPGITKGNHWHNTKNEKFLVVKGEGLISLRKIGTDEIIDYRVNGDELTVVDIPCGYTHSITNVGTDDMVTVMWINEMFNPDVPDTIYEAVRE